MYIELNPDGSVLNTYDTNTAGEWYPDDTALIQESVDGLKYSPTFPLRISRLKQSPDWPDRAAREYNTETNLWESTGEPTQETDLEKAIRLLRENEVPAAPDDLPDSPTNAQLVQQLRDVTTQVQAHRRFIAGYRKIFIRLLRFIGVRVLNG